MMIRLESSRMTLTSSQTTIYLDWDKKSSRTNTCNCFSQVRLTKETTFHPCPGDKKDARFGAARARVPLDRDRQSERDLFITNLPTRTATRNIFPVSELNVLTHILSTTMPRSLLFSCRLYRRSCERAQFYGIWKYYEIFNSETDNEIE